MLKRASFPVGLVVALAVFGACSSTDGAAIAINSTDVACKVAATELKAGSTTFAVTNDGDDVTEVYVFGEKDRVMGEVENIGPGTSRNFTVNLSAGDYEVACKPGMKGDGIRTPISVTGKGGNVTATATETIEVSATDYEFAGLAKATFEAGETVEFILQNEAPAEEHELEVFGPDGDAIGEVGPTKAGTTGRVTLTLSEPGTYRVVCGIEDHESRGMTGKFEVS